MANLGGISSAAAFGSAAFVAACTFTNNTFPEDSDYASSQITAAGNASQVWLQDVTLIRLYLRLQAYLAVRIPKEAKPTPTNLYQTLE